MYAGAVHPDIYKQATNNTNRASGNISLPPTKTGTEPLSVDFHYDVASKKALALTWQELELSNRHAAADAVRAARKLTFGEAEYQAMLDEAMLNA